VGALFLVLALGSAVAVVVFAIEAAFPGSLSYANRPISPVDAGANLVAAAVLGYTVLSMMLRWRRWRIWSGTVSWGLIAIVAFSQFTPPLGPYRSIERMAGLIVLAIVVFALAAKRREPRLDIAAVFDS
jgi:hypothetical protein